MTEPAEKLSRGSGYGDGAKPVPLSAVSKKASESDKSKPVIIKKYANRRLYNTETSSYVTLEDLGEMVRSERDFLVYDAKTAEDLTHTVLTQIIVEEEGKTGSNLLPIGFLRQLIRFYGHSIEQIVPKYLEFSLTALTREQEKYHKQFTDTFGNVAFGAMQEQARQNMAIFERAFSMFAPFAKIEMPAEGEKPQHGKKPEATETPSTPELAELKKQLAAMQAQIDQLTKAKADQEKR
ncbi:polyhydroxyalkanoate synthesis repressor PhaR [Rhodomicrobium sp. Az07]|uniref:polyhydroxyalkanoate synthesis repressor PhaR n=1 Tax=Rhodomicrobium sp. Az07 TaxID=2839034 RepID=UPI001BE80AB9|nr:polyhydroxyalkanoate synthesis repressor PhaR [Rhodomicrobium sp. Az07]MBT3071497.1 polyhydroxyalkanoate synthesis repressor PhaR [Rhodomicrobium sp. Az07]